MYYSGCVYMCVCAVCVCVCMTSVRRSVARRILYADCVLHSRNTNIDAPFSGAHYCVCYISIHVHAAYTKRMCTHTNQHSWGWMGPIARTDIVFDSGENVGVGSGGGWG